MNEPSCENCLHQVGGQVMPDAERGFSGSANGLCSWCTFGWIEMGVLDSWKAKPDDAK